MGAKQGNTNANGNKGGKKGKSGRKSAYAEIADADFLWKLFTEPLSRAELQKKVRSGKHSILDAFTMKGLAGNERVIIEMFKKLFPDNVNLTGNLQQKNIIVLEGNIRKILEAIPQTATRVPTKPKVTKKK